MEGGNSKKRGGGAMSVVSEWDFQQFVIVRWPQLLSIWCMYIVSYTSHAMSMGIFKVGMDLFHFPSIKKNKTGSFHTRAFVEPSF